MGREVGEAKEKGEDEKEKLRGVVSKEKRKFCKYHLQNFIS